jgi:hypothetical protein
VSTWQASDHGYLRYSFNRCRCDVCRAGKAEYARNRRAAAAELRKQATAAGQVYIAQGIRHGISGYRDASCRCDVCFRAAKAARVRRERRLAAMAGAS